MSFLENIWVIQGLGFVAFAFGVSSFWQKKDGHFRGLLACQSFALSIHYALLNQHTGAVVTMINALRNLLAIRGNLKPLVPLFVLFYFAFGISRYQEWYDLLPVLGSSLATWATFYLKGITLRRVYICATLMYLLFNIIIGSIGPALMEFSQLMVNLLNIRRMDKDKNRH